MKRIPLILVSVLLVCLFYSPAFCQTPNTSQELSGIERTRQLREREKALEQQLEKKKKKPEIEEKVPPEVAPAAPSEKVNITKINIAGVTLFPKKEIDAVAKPFEGNELSLNEMQRIADLITELYRKKGYITSRAYIPPQRIESGTLEIRVIEGKMGNVEVKDNYYYKNYLYKKKLKILNKGQSFNYFILAKALRRINEQPDRTVKAVLVPGKEPGQTDIILETKETLPIHAEWDFDNYGTRYIYYDRYNFSATHNNLSGNDDIFNFRYTITEADAYKLIGGSYILPVTDTAKIGASAFWSKVHLLEDYKALDVRGESELFSLFATQRIIDEENCTTNLSAGFDFKDIFNYQFNNETSRDKMRVLKVGLDTDVTDPLGRSIVTHEIDMGIPCFIFGLKPKDIRASRPGSGGEFAKYVLNFFRLQPMPFESMIMCKNQLQVTSMTMTSTEEFQLGGIVNVRGYPPAELVGDYGLSTTVEWYFPPYFLPKDLKIPFTKTTFYNAVRLVAFYDYGNVMLRHPLPTEKRLNQLSDFGWGIRFNLPKNFSFRVDFACPVNKQSSDGKDIRTLMQISANL